MEAINLRIHAGQQAMQWEQAVVSRTAPTPLPALHTDDPAALQSYGQRLYDTYLRDTLIETALSRRDAPLMLRVYDEAEQRWELLHDGTDYLAFSRLLILRSSLPDLSRLSLAVERPPLRILVTTVSTPTGLSKLQAGELDTLLHRLERTHPGLIEVTILRNPSRMRWLRVVDDAAIEGKPFHIWHYAGEQPGAETLQLDGSTLTFEQINTLLGIQQTLKGIILDIRGGHAHLDGLRGLTAPFVIMPQIIPEAEISTLFFQLFYESLTDKGLAEAVFHARQKVYAYSVGDGQQASAMTVYSRTVAHDLFARPPKNEEFARMLVRDQVFVSYSHQDTTWCQRLMDYLEPLRQNHVVKAWVDTDIEVGSNWFDEIQKGLAQAKVAVLLASPAFFRSQFIQNHELPYILEQRESGTCTIIWVAVSAHPYEFTPLDAIQAAHSPQEPLDRLLSTAADDVLIKVVRLVAAALKEK